MVMQSAATREPLVAVIPISDLTLEQRRSFRLDALTRAIRRAADKRIINQDINSNGLARQIRPDSDLNFGGVTYNQWITGATTAGALITLVNSTQVSNRQLVVIYGISHNEPIPGLGEFQFSRGTAGGGGMMAIVDVAPYLNRLENEFYLSRAILWDPQDIIFIQAMPYITNALGERWVLHGYTIEAIGDTIAVPVS